MAERIEQGTSETYGGDNHLALLDDHNIMHSRSFIETTVNCDRLVVSFCILAKCLNVDQILFYTYTCIGGSRILKICR